MVHAITERSASGRLPGLRVWHLSLLVLYVAIAILQIQEQRITEPALIVLASAGFLVYGVLGWLGARRVGSRAGSVKTLVLYSVAMAALFLVATIAYVALENHYRMGHF